MGVCTRKRVVYDISCKRLQFFVNVEALVTADILTKLLQQCFLIFIVVPWLYLGNSQVSVYRTIGPTLVLNIQA